MPTQSVASNVVNATQNVSQNVADKVNEYHMIASVAQHMFTDFLERVPYF